MKIRTCELTDIQAICEIYNHYIENTFISFEEVPLDVAEMSGRIEHTTKSYPWLVCEVDGAVLGYAYASKWKERTAYKNTVEISVYLKNSQTGKGYGKALYSALIDTLTKMNCHVALACIALPNAESEGLHEYFGFEKIAHFSEVGRKFERWVDVGYWQKTIG